METSSPGIFACTLLHWQPGLKDPYLSSWIMVLIYLVAAVLAFTMAGKGMFPDSARRRERLFWVLIAGLLLALAINKQADLQSLLTAFGRCLAKSQGWYDQRRMVQLVFFQVLGVSAIGGVCTLIWGLRRRLHANALPLLGLAFVAIFILSRAADTYHLDTQLVVLLHARWTERILELSGPLIISVAVLRSLFGNFRRVPAIDDDQQADR